jgi:hypothetical protein
MRRAKEGRRKTVETRILHWENKGGNSRTDTFVSLENSKCKIRVETVYILMRGGSTSLKRGVNEREFSPRSVASRILCGLLVCLVHIVSSGAQKWESALTLMPLQRGVTELSRTNCLDVMLRAFQSNEVVKALIFMPGATDEFYMFRRARAELTNASPTLLDAVSALTNQTLIRATFRSPFLLLHSDEDPLDPLITIESESAAEKLKRARFVTHGVYNDRDWDFMQPILRECLKADILPWHYSRASWHFYRHSFAAWNLNGWEALEAVAFAGKTRFMVRRKSLVDLRVIEVEFKPDARVRAVPTLEYFPR